MKTREKVNEKLRRLRLQRKLSQENAAAEFNLDYGTYNSYEKNGAKIQVKTLEKIANFYGFKDLTEFFNDEVGETGTHVFEPFIPYITKKNSIKVIIELDGVEDHLKEWYLKLEKINQALV